MTRPPRYSLLALALLSLASAPHARAQGISAEASYASQCPCEFQWDLYALGIKAGALTERLEPDGEGRWRLSSKLTPGALARSLGANAFERESSVERSAKGASSLRFKERKLGSARGGAHLIQWSVEPLRGSERALSGSFERDKPEGEAPERSERASRSALPVWDSQMAPHALALGGSAPEAALWLSRGEAKKARVQGSLSSGQITLRREGDFEDQLTIHLRSRDALPLSLSLVGRDGSAQARLAKATGKNGIDLMARGEPALAAAPAEPARAP